MEKVLEKNCWGGSFVNFQTQQIFEYKLSSFLYYTSSKNVKISFFRNMLIIYIVVYKIKNQNQIFVKLSIHGKYTFLNR
jgi:hypothetical protein